MIAQRRDTQAIIVAQDSPIATLAELRGKRIAFGKGSGAHNLLVATLEKAGIAWSDITPAPLAPADATAAFVKGSVDAWSIRDPDLSLAEIKDHARATAFDKDIQHSTTARPWRFVRPWTRKRAVFRDAGATAACANPFKAFARAELASDETDRGLGFLRH